MWINPESEKNPTKTNNMHALFCLRRRICRTSQLLGQDFQPANPSSVPIQEFWRVQGVFQLSFIKPSIETDPEIPWEPRGVPWTRRFCVWSPSLLYYWSRSCNPFSFLFFFPPYFPLPFTRKTALMPSLEYFIIILQNCTLGQTHVITHSSLLLLMSHKWDIQAPGFPERTQVLGNCC